MIARISCAHANTTFLTKINERVAEFDRNEHFLHPMPRRLPERLFKREKRHIIPGDTVGTTIFSFIIASLAVVEGCVCVCVRRLCLTCDCVYSLFTDAEYAMWTAFVEVIECMQAPMCVK